MLSLLVFFPLAAAAVLLLPQVGERAARGAFVAVTGTEVALSGITWATYDAPPSGGLAFEVNHAASKIGEGNVDIDGWIRKFIEAKPGIPPTPRHVQEVIALMQNRHIAVLFASNYFAHTQIRDVAERTNAQAVIVPENTHGAPGVESYFDLINAWVGGLAQGFSEGSPR